MQIRFNKANKVYFNPIGRILSNEVMSFLSGKELTAMCEVNKGFNNLITLSSTYQLSICTWKFNSDDWISKKAESEIDKISTKVESRINRLENSFGCFAMGWTCLGSGLGTGVVTGGAQCMESATCGCCGACSGPSCLFTSSLTDCLCKAECCIFAPCSIPCVVSYSCCVISAAPFVVEACHMQKEERLKNYLRYLNSDEAHQSMTANIKNGLASNIRFFQAEEKRKAERKRELTEVVPANQPTSCWEGCIAWVRKLM